MRDDFVPDGHAKAQKLERYPPDTTNISHPVGTFESMIFLFPKVGYVSVPWRVHFWMLSQKRAVCWTFNDGKISQAPRGASRIARHSVEAWHVKKRDVRIQRTTETWKMEMRMEMKMS